MNEDIHQYAKQLRDHMRDRFDVHTPESQALYDQTKHFVEAVESGRDENYLYDQAKRLENHIHEVRNSGMFDTAHYQEFYKHSDSLRQQIQQIRMGR